jgi:hypothetical protein
MLIYKNYLPKVGFWISINLTRNVLNQSLIHLTINVDFPLTLIFIKVHMFDIHYCFMAHT